MSMKGRISIILFCLFSSIVLAQATTKQVFDDAIDSMIRSQGLDRATTSIIADSAYRSYIKEHRLQDPSAIVFVNRWTLGMASSEDHQIISASGTVVSLKPPKSPEAFTISRRVPHGVDTSNEEKGFWDSVLQPALVTLGAVAIIALFFLIRS